MMQQIQNNVASLRVSNIQFSVKKKYSKQCHSQNHNFHPQINKIDRKNSKSNSVMLVQGFIPKSTIRTSNRTLSNQRKIDSTPLSLYENYYSKFPYRKPKSIKINNFISIFRRKIKINSENQNKTNDQFSFKVINRTKTNVSIDRDQNQQQSRAFRPYSNANIKTQQIFRQKTISSNYQQVGRLYL